MACDFIIVIMLLRIGSVEETVAGVMNGYVWGACTIAFIAWMLPSQSDLRLGDEDYLGPNQIGYACAFAVFFAQYLMRRGEKGFVIPAAFLASHSSYAASARPRSLPLSPRRRFFCSATGS